jgi:hypothetical protein
MNASSRPSGRNESDRPISIPEAMIGLEAQLAGLFHNLLVGEPAEIQSVCAYGHTIVEMFVCDRDIKEQLGPARMAT